MTDCTQRFTFDGTDIRGEVVSLSSSYQEILSNHHYPPAVELLLGEFIALAVLLSTSIKFDGRLVLQARSEGDVSLIMAECSSEQIVRAIAQIAPGFISEDLHAQLAGGVLAITVEPDQGERYQSLVPLMGNSLAECMEHYFLQSEQLNSVFILALQARRVKGLLLQQLPAQLVKDSDERRSQWEHVVHLARTLGSSEMIENDTETLLHRLYHQEDLRLYPARTVQHRCSCSRERTVRMLQTLGKDEFASIIQEQGSVSVNCEFCNQEYQFYAADMTTIFAGLEDVTAAGDDRPGDDPVQH